MTRLRYGFDPSLPNADNPPWTKLATIAEYLEDCEVIPPDLAAWLGEAIRHSGQDRNELLRRLGLAKGRGKPSADPKAWLKYGEEICELEEKGMKPEAAIARVSATINNGLNEKYNRTQLQKFRDEYRKARHSSQAQ
ncbi:hypothetical protein [Stenotrophobium rhamnosiphilum]|uniref:Uncharacterized protein n=1 Tax=Stenotrophobium rhamnosiphilum TaxID=2029166 RepID=A0A2T5MI36_9GAMM|nr:hypothetical protein [Stenotrophobium rhamnosiphilum]PTU32242.1 hypothetical protein CJD38_06180 [Stenotrophobium rhamnosiphilum]